jgi:transcriptional regulator with XRE-family HTH domain
LAGRVGQQRVGCRRLEKYTRAAAWPAAPEGEMAEQDWIDPQDFRFLLLNARWMRGWTQRQLAAAAGVDKATIDRYENGRVPPRKVAERIFAAAGRSLAWLEVTLLPGLHAARLGHPEEPPPPPTRDDAPKFATSLAREIEAALVHLEAGMPDDEEGERTLEADAQRQAAEALWAILAPCAPQERRVLVERLPAYQTWAMVERLSWESEREAANPDAALELAHLARRAAERIAPEPERERAAATPGAMRSAR